MDLGKFKNYSKYFSTCAAWSPDLRLSKDLSCRLTTLALLVGGLITWLWATWCISEVAVVGFVGTHCGSNRAWLVAARTECFRCLAEEHFFEVSLIFSSIVHLWEWENFCQLFFQKQNQKKPTFTAASVETVHIVVSSYRPVLALPSSFAATRTCLFVHFNCLIFNSCIVISHLFLFFNFVSSYSLVLALPPSCAAMEAVYFFVCLYFQCQFLSIIGYTCH